MYFPFSAKVRLKLSWKPILGKMNLALKVGLAKLSSNN